MYGCGMPTKEAKFLGLLVTSHAVLAYALVVEICHDFLNSNIPHYFLDFFGLNQNKLGLLIKVHTMNISM